MIAHKHARSLPSYSKVASDASINPELLEPLCKSSNTLKIVKEFRNFYDERLRKTEEETKGKSVELKLKILTSWVNDLGEQNLVLVESVEQLEREAAERVAVLENRLRKSSDISWEYMSKMLECEDNNGNLPETNSTPLSFQINVANKLRQAQHNEELLRMRIGNLQNDVSSLLELIRRAYYERSWDTNGLSFVEVTLEDIFGHNLNYNYLLNPVGQGNNFVQHDVIYPPMNQNQSNNYFQNVNNSDLLKKLEDANFNLQKTIIEKEQLMKKIESLSFELESKAKYLTSLSKTYSESERILKRKTEDLTTELTEQHRKLLKARDCILQLEKRLHESEIQTHLKNAIIKEMRKKIKSFQAKISAAEKKQSWCLHLASNESKPLPNDSVEISQKIPSPEKKMQVFLHKADQTCKYKPTTSKLGVENSSKTRKTEKKKKLMVCNTDKF